MHNKSLKIHRVLALFWTAFIGVGAVFGSMMFFLDPQNGFIMGMLLEPMRTRLPLGNIFFQDFIFSGIALLIVNGISNLTAFVLILLNKRIGYFLGWLFGITLMMWICIQFYVFAPNLYGIDIAYFLFGMSQFICGYTAYARYRQSLFTFSENDYANMGTTEGSGKLVVYFSRDGYAKKLAYEKANELCCDVTELKTSEPTSGNAGFWWCGRFGLTGREMNIEPIEDVASSVCSDIYVVSPVWVFGLCAPIKTFIKSVSAKKIRVHLTILHFLGAKMRYVFNYPRKVLGAWLVEEHSVTCRFGNFRVLS